MTYKNKKDKRKYMKEYHLKNKDRIAKRNKEYRQSLVGRYRYTMGNGKFRDTEFALTLREYGLISAMPCFYCGTTDSANRSGEPVRMGIDQLVPRAGYTIENTTACCWACNKAKNNVTMEIAERMLYAKERKGFEG